MTKEKFYEILKEEGVNKTTIDGLWKTRPSDDLDEEILRKITREYLLGEINEEK